MTTVSLARDTMRTRFEILLHSEHLSSADLRAAGQEALDEISRVEGWLSAFRPDSDLYRINAMAAKKPVRVDARFLSLLIRASQLSAITDGAFDMSVGALLQIWRDRSSAGTTPADSEITAALTFVGMEAHVILDKDAQSVAFDRESVRLDPGAIGKGYALDRAATLLREAGIENALLHGGTSTVVAIGHAPDNQNGWPIAIRHPTLPEAHLDTVILQNQCLSVSAVHGHTFHATGGRRFGHILDPRTGYPVESALLSAVAASSATDTDALSTALLVLGTPRIHVLAKHFAEAGFLITDREPVNQDGGGNEISELRVLRKGGPWASRSDIRKRNL